MQRPTSLSRALDERHHHVIDIGECSPRRQSKDIIDPFDRSSVVGGGWREVWMQYLWRSSQKYWIHAIPVIVLLCFFIVWWFSYPVKLEIKDGQILGMYRIDTDSDDVDLTSLALASPPNASIPQIPRLNNKAEVEPVSPTD